MGTFRYFRCCDNIEDVENYELAKADNFRGWICHHRLETHNSDGERRLVDIKKEELIALDMYYHRPAEELIFMTRSEHYTLHKCHKDKQHSEETKKHLSEINKGKKLSEETKKKIGEAKKGKHPSEETRRKMSVSLKGHPVSEESRRKTSEFCKGKHWKVVDGKRVWY
jgi:hypothetical protein